MLVTSIFIIAPVSLLASVFWTSMLAHYLYSKRIKGKNRKIIIVIVSLVILLAIAIVLSLISMGFVAFIIGMFFPFIALILGIFVSVIYFRQVEIAKKRIKEETELYESMYIQEE